MSVTVEEFELLSFFEVEPQRLDSQIAWPYNRFSYRVQIGVNIFTFCIEPAYKHVSFTLACDSAEVYKFSATSVVDVRYSKQSDRESLEIVITDSDHILLQLHPAISITQLAEGGKA